MGKRQRPRRERCFGFGRTLAKEGGADGRSGKTPAGGAGIAGNGCGNRRRERRERKGRWPGRRREGVPAPAPEALARTVRARFRKETKTEAGGMLRTAGTCPCSGAARGRLCGMGSAYAGRYFRQEHSRPGPGKGAARARAGWPEGARVSQPAGETDGQVEVRKAVVVRDAEAVALDFLDYAAGQGCDRPQRADLIRAAEELPGRVAFVKQAARGFAVVAGGLNAEPAGDGVSPTGRGEGDLVRGGAIWRGLFLSVSFPLQ